MKKKPNLAKKTLKHIAGDKKDFGKLKHEIDEMEADDRKFKKQLKKKRKK